MDTNDFSACVGRVNAVLAQAGPPDTKIAALFQLASTRSDEALMAICAALVTSKTLTSRDQQRGDL